MNILPAGVLLIALLVLVLQVEQMVRRRRGED